MPASDTLPAPTHPTGAPTALGYRRGAESPSANVNNPPGNAHQTEPGTAPTVNRALTPNRRRRVVENDDYAAFTRRILAAHGRRVARGDVDGLADLARLATEVDAATAHAVTGLRTAGYSWAEIGARLGMTRQAAQQRWGNSQ